MATRLPLALAQLRRTRPRERRPRDPRRCRRARRARRADGSPARGVVPGTSARPTSARPRTRCSTPPAKACASRSAEASPPCTTRTAGWASLGVWQRLRDEGLAAPARLAVHPGRAGGRARRPAASARRFGDDLMRLGYLKAFMDGTLGSQTARLLDGSGVQITSREELADIVRARRAAGLAGRRARDRGSRQPRGAGRLRGDPRRRGSRSACATGSSTRSARAGGHARASPSSASPASVQFSHAPSDRELADRFWSGKTDGAYAFRSLLGRGRRRRQRLRRADRGARPAGRDPRRRAAHDRRPPRLASGAGAHASSRRSSRRR